MHVFGFEASFPSQNNLKIGLYPKPVGKIAITSRPEKRAFRVSIFGRHDKKIPAVLQPSSMESQMVQNSRHKNGLTFSKIAIKVKRDFNQAQQNQFTFNRFSLKVKTFRFKLNKIMSSLSTNFLSSSRDHLRYFQRNIFLIFKLCSTSTPNFSSRFNNSTFQGQDTNNVTFNVAKSQHQQLEYVVNNPNTLSTT